MDRRPLLEVAEVRRGVSVIAFATRVLTGGTHERRAPPPRYLDLLAAARELAKKHAIANPRVIMTFYRRETPIWLPEGAAEQYGWFMSEEACRSIKVEIFPRAFGPRDFNAKWEEEQ